MSITPRTEKILDKIFLTILAITFIVAMAHSFYGGTLLKMDATCKYTPGEYSAETCQKVTELREPFLK